jgi:hypothetical protein
MVAHLNRLMLKQQVVTSRASAPATEDATTATISIIFKWQTYFF